MMTNIREERAKNIFQFRFLFKTRRNKVRRTKSMGAGNFSFGFTVSISAGRENISIITNDIFIITDAMRMGKDASGSKINPSATAIIPIASTEDKSGKKMMFEIGPMRENGNPLSKKNGKVAREQKTEVEMIPNTFPAEREGKRMRKRTAENERRKERLKRSKGFISMMKNPDEKSALRGL